MPRRSTWHDRLLARLLERLSALQPDTAARAGAALGVLAFHLGIRRRIVQENMGLALGLRGTRRRRLARRSYATMGADFIEIWTAPNAAMVRKARVLDPRWIRSCFAEGRGVIVLTLHLGHWDLGPAGVALATGRDRIPVYATPQHGPAVDEVLKRCRAAVRMDVIEIGDDRRGGGLGILRALRGGGCVGILADQGPRAARGRPGWFLGQPTICHHGPAQLALAARVPLVPGFCLRRSATESVLAIGRPIAVEGRDPDAVMQDGLDRLSAVIAAFPAQYFWHHRRFKRRAELPPRDAHPWRTEGLRLVFGRGGEQGGGEKGREAERRTQSV